MLKTIFANAVILKLAILLSSVFGASPFLLAFFNWTLLLVAVFLTLTSITNFND